MAGLPVTSAAWPGNSGCLRSKAWARWRSRECDRFPAGRYLCPPMDPQQLAERVVARMFDHDPFSQWLGIHRDRIAPGECVLSMVVKAEMLNGFSIAHGGI